MKPMASQQTLIVKMFAANVNAGASRTTMGLIPEATRGVRPLNEKIRGGGHIGSNAWFGFHTSWPLACLSVAQDSLTFSMWPVTYRFERSSIRCLLTKRLRLGRELTARPSLLIVHTNPAFPKSVIFQPRQFPLLVSLLARNGYLLAEEADLSTTEPIRYSNVIPAITYIVVIVALIAAFIAISIAAGLIGRK